jgi:TolB-like protein
MGMEATPAADIYSLGVVMYQMLTGQLPFDADHEAALLYSILHENPKPLSACGVSIPKGVEAIIMRCLEKHPDRRFPSCAELAKELNGCRKSASLGGNGDHQQDKPSIAVLPFTNMSADPENEYFSDGLTEELLNVLAKNPGLKVTGRTSCFAFKGKHEDLREIGHKLGVETLLEGSVRKAGNRVRITTQLVKVADGFHLWSETYDRIVDDIFAVQDDIAQAVSKALHVTLLGQPQTKAKGNAETYSLILQANHFNTRNTKDAVEKAIALYEKVLAIEPEDARAWAGISRAFATQGGYGFADNEEAYRKARHAAEKAVMLDDTLPDAHDTMGWIAMSYECDWEKAGREFRRAFALAPGKGRSLVGLASYEATIGQFADANRHAKESVEIDPLSAVAHLWRGRIQLASRLYDQALESYTKALELSPGIASANSIAGVVLMSMGRHQEALDTCGKEDSTGYRSCGLAMIYHGLGDKQNSDEQLAILLGEGEQWGVQIAFVYAWRGEKDKAFEWLERSRHLRDPGLHIIKYSPAFENLHDDPRWGAFLEKIGLGG